MRRIITIAGTACLATGLALAETAPVAAPTGQKTLAATMNVHAFPTKGQTPEQQSQDEAACYDYAKTNTGTDPFELKKQADQAAAQTEQAKAQAGQATRGAGAKGAVKGAAAGAVVGEIADDDAGEGAAVGAAAGAVAARRKARKAGAQAEQQAEQAKAQTQQATAEQLTNFKKAFSVCLEAKNYMVKY
jgi:hypothetical protein